MKIWVVSARYYQTHSTVTYPLFAKYPTKECPTMWHVLDRLFAEAPRHVERHKIVYFDAYVENARGAHVDQGDGKDGL